MIRHDEMRNTSTQRIKETTIYRILGDIHIHVTDFVLRDAFTCTLLAMVLATNLLIILIPATTQLWDEATAKNVCSALALLLLPGYAALLVMLVSRVKHSSKTYRYFDRIDKGHLSLSKSSRLRNTIVGIQCLLFVSLLCSTFIMRHQLKMLKPENRTDHTEHVIRKETFSESHDVRLIPLLREYVSM